MTFIVFELFYKFFKLQKTDRNIHDLIHINAVDFCPVVMGQFFIYIIWNSFLNFRVLIYMSFFFWSTRLTFNMLYTWNRNLGTVLEKSQWKRWYVSRWPVSQVGVWIYPGVGACKDIVPMLLWHSGRVDHSIPFKRFLKN